MKGGELDETAENSSFLRGFEILGLSLRKQSSRNGHFSTFPLAIQAKWDDFSLGIGPKPN